MSASVSFALGNLIFVHQIQPVSEKERGWQAIFNLFKNTERRKHGTPATHPEGTTFDFRSGCLLSWLKPSPSFLPLRFHIIHNYYLIDAIGL
jgi:hypothetical protein